MNKTNITAIKLIKIDGDLITTDSRTVAKLFGKRHDRVLRAFDNVECSQEFNRLNFGVVEIPDAKGECRRVIQMTKDGFMFLVMGFTGKEAASMKESFINSFNEMADRLQNKDKNLWQQMQALIAKEVESKVKASFGSHLMLNRKKEIPHFRDERYQLESEIQKPLFIN